MMEMIKCFTEQILYSDIKASSAHLNSQKGPKTWAKSGKMNFASWPIDEHLLLSCITFILSFAIQIGTSSTRL